MANMSYCRFRNTAGDLYDCIDHLWDQLDREEHNARVWLIKMCKQIAEEVMDDDWPIELRRREEDDIG